MELAVFLDNVLLHSWVDRGILEDVAGLILLLGPGSKCQRVLLSNINLLGRPESKCLAICLAHALDCGLLGVLSAAIL